MIQKVREQLIELADEKYKEFNQSLVPGETVPMLGVRLPKLRDIAKKIAKENGPAGQIYSIYQQLGSL